MSHYSPARTNMDAADLNPSARQRSVRVQIPRWAQAASNSTMRNNAEAARAMIRDGQHHGNTSNLAPGHVQANLAVVPASLAFDFLLFATRNPKPCPLVEVVETGVEARRTAPGSDLRTDLPGYRLFVDGEHVDSASDATTWWREDMVAFLLGCSFSFDAALLKAGIPVRHTELGRNVSMYVTDQQCEPAGPFSAPLVVSMRPLPEHLVESATELTASYGHAHGGPIHVGDPTEIGIADITSPDFGDSVPILDGEVPAFWACGVTPQLAIARARPEVAISHEPGSMFITDLSDGL